MYEDRTFDAIMQELLDEVPAEVDKREGSIVYVALAPAAAKIETLYQRMDADYRLSHAQTSSGAELRALGADFGLDPKAATPAIRKGLFKDDQNAPFDVPIGSTFSTSGLNFTVTEKLAAGDFKLQCETAGTTGNIPSGALLPQDYINGLATATLTSVLVPGEDEESDDEYRVRYFAQVRTPPTSGNRAAYRKWALEMPGIGDAYVQPNWNGPNTVKVFLLGPDKLPASAGSVQAVKDYIDPNIGLGEGMGEGQAPAGAVVTTVSAPTVAINVSATVVLSGSRTLAQVKTDFTAALIAHLASIAYSQDRSMKFARLGTILLDTPGVQDYDTSKLLLNGGTANVQVPAGSVAVIGAVTLT
ncbi:baseplate J/gp47 family protein [Paenibacillus gansuensis]|uniref:Baseplate J/gp47 family protein n=1 Tax=Paenibacillus gansuensis TaxID=306542 RepID=A0ABW5PFN1_9BACL